jgi:hypothetical protein
MAAGWTELFSSLHRSLLAVLRAELDALLGDLSDSGRRLIGVLTMLAAAAAFFVVFLGVIVVAAVAALALAVPVWAAALIVAGVLGLVAGICGWLGVRRLRSIENPADTVRRRVADHAAWWQTRLVAEKEAFDDVDEA